VAHHGDRSVGDPGEDGQRVAHAHLDPARLEASTTARIGGPEVRELWASPIPLVREIANDLLEDRRPARLELDPDRPSRSARDGRPEQRPADPGEWVKDEVTGPAEELDESGHQPRRLVRPVRSPCRMPEF